MRVTLRMGGLATPEGMSLRYRHARILSWRQPSKTERVAGRAGTIFLAAGMQAGTRLVSPQIELFIENGTFVFQDDQVHARTWHAVPNPTCSSR